MSKAKFDAVRELIAEQRYEEARTILETIDDPKARDWEEKIELILSDDPDERPEVIILKPSGGGKRNPLFIIAIVFLVVVCACFFIIVILALLGPVIGNVFSEIVEGFDATPAR